MKRAVVLVALAGCWSGGASVTPPPPARIPETVPPEIRFAHGAPTTVRLPAVARDGALVVYAELKSDGARGNPNLRLVAKRRDDTVETERVVLDANTFDAMTDDTVRRAIADGNDWLAQLHGAHPLVALAALPAAERPEPNHRDEIRGDGFTISWAESTRALAIADGEPVVSSLTPTSWLVAPSPMYAGSPDLCENPAHLTRAWVARAPKLALLEISYDGTDTCWEPPPQLHVIAW